ncbi:MULTISPECIES: alanine racemase [Rhodopseudomonas]|uniref:alanine racemase n=1 Tax=Rhodopseudomonas TaxID=1073 RepID=UPI0005C9AAD5|nr:MULTISPECIES: alanine racemase [Rhodopseudomonas]MDF3808908.1 alanine racemase [Rhodopseudomonas sp. BAL398]WOK18383.1 alanine racemase [Rhodopseudomonas sp. BAL398]
MSVAADEAVDSDAAVFALAQRHGTPLFLYDAPMMRDAAARLRRAAPPGAQLFYAVKANPAPGVIRLFAALGLGAEVASGGELQLALDCGVAPDAIVFSGPAKTASELAAAAEAGIYAVQAESWDELAVLQNVCAQRGLTARVALRVNLGSVGARRGGWGGVSPFGMDQAALDYVVAHAARLDRLRIIGVHNHQSSQTLDPHHLVARFEAFAQVAARLNARFGFDFINFGGGFGAPFYADDEPIDLDPVRAFFAGLSGGPLGDWRPRIAMESGRFLTGPAGAYVVRVVGVKRCFGVRFALLDGGIHHMLGLSGTMRALRRPVAVRRLGGRAGEAMEPTELAGPLCTPIDRLAGAAPLPADLAAGDLLLFGNCGAYAKHASPLNFLGHDWPAEVLRDGARNELLAPRRSFAEVMAQR